MGRLWLYPITHRAGPMWGGWVVGAPHPVTHRAGPIRGLGHHTLSHRAIGRSGDWGAPHYQAQSRADQGGWGAFPCHEQSRVDREVVALPPVTHRAAGRSGGLGATPCHADPSAGRPRGSTDPSAGRHITLLLYRIEAWCMGGGQLVCPEGCSGSAWGSPLGCLASLDEGLMAVCSWSHTLQGWGSPLGCLASLGEGMMAVFRLAGDGSSHPLLFFFYFFLFWASFSSEAWLQLLGLCC
uniref:Uncharacterized protein n=1 Tax=Myotis myotis TaxID=51298 RepID=A0A7J7VIX3_MYOMY|nr:hypothetical protein mMyoMyo1_008347 [Myotis myotis]